MSKLVSLNPHYGAIIATSIGIQDHWNIFGVSSWAIFPVITVKLFNSGTIELRTKLTSIGLQLGGATCRPYYATADDGFKYALKLPKCNGDCRLLVNELLASLLIKTLNLFTPEPAIIEISSTLNDLKLDDKLRTKLEIISEKFPDKILCFGSRIWEGSKNCAESIDKIHETSIICNAVVFDTWVFNQDARQFLGLENTNGKFELCLFDNDGAFNRHDWLIDNDPAKNLRRTDFENKNWKTWVTEKLDSNEINMFQPALDLLNTSISASILKQLASKIPNEWLTSIPRQDNLPDLNSLLQLLDERRGKVKNILFKNC